MPHRNGKLIKPIGVNDEGMQVLADFRGGVTIDDPTWQAVARAQLLYIPAGYHTLKIAPEYNRVGRLYTIPFPAMVVDNQYGIILLAPGDLRVRSKLYIPYLYNFFSNGQSCGGNSVQRVFQTQFSGKFYCESTHFPKEFRTHITQAEGRFGLYGQYDYDRFQDVTLDDVQGWDWNGVSSSYTYETILTQLEKRVKVQAEALVARAQKAQNWTRYSA